MKFAGRDSRIELNQGLIVQMVQAVVKAVTEDAPQYRRDHHLETNNAANFIVGDYINENLRKLVASENVQLCGFKRFAWSGRFIIDDGNRTTYSVMSASTLSEATKKHGNKPYYLDSFLNVENNQCEGKQKQLVIQGYGFGNNLKNFSDEEYQQDYGQITHGFIEEAEDYRHYILEYKAEHSEIIDIRLLYLDKAYAVVDSLDLSEYIMPDFASLTAGYIDMPEANTETGSPTVKITIKAGIKPMPYVGEDEA